MVSPASTTVATSTNTSLWKRGRAVRCGAALSVWLLDVDFFERCNDRHGHQAGDDALRRVAACLKPA